MVRSTIARLAVTAALGATVLNGFPTLAFADTSAELQTQLDDANAHLDGLYSQASELGQQLLETQQDLETTEDEISQKQAELDQAQDTLATRVNANYKTGGVSIASIIFNSSSFEDLVNRIYYASKVSASDAEAIQSVKQIQDDLTAKQAEQKQLLSEQQAKKAEVDAKTSEAEQYVDSLSQELQDQLAAELAARLAEQRTLQQQASEQAAANGGSYIAGDAVVAEVAASGGSGAGAGGTTSGGAASGDSASGGTSAGTTGTGGSASGGGSASTPAPSTPSGGGATSDGAANSKPSGGSGSGNVADDEDSVSGGLTSAQREAIVAAAWSQVGKAYVLGANGPDAYDCSSFVRYCYAVAGISLPRTSYAQGAWGSATSNPQPGDIIAWGGHVGIYISDGMMIDAGNERTGVIYRSIYGSPWYRTA